MTTHYQKIQALGERMATNLETMGVSASFSDGGLTLADKILEIEQGTCQNGIFLYAGKDLCQTSDTVGIGAVAVQSGKLIDDTITVYKSNSIYQNKMTSSASEWLVIDEDYDGLTVTSNGATLDASTGETTTNDVYLNRSIDIKNDSHIIEFDCKPLSGSSACVSGQIFYKVGGDGYYENFWIMSSGGTLCDDSFSLPSGYTFGDWTHVKMEWTPTQQKIYINGTLADTTTQDYSSASGYDDLYLTLRCSGSGYGFIVKNMSIITNPASVCTGSHGSCTGTYTGSGAGLKQFVAVCGSVQSEPYIIEDCFFVEKATSSTDIQKYNFDTSVGNSMSISNGRLKFEVGSSNKYFMIDTTSNNAWTLSDFTNKKVTVKVDVAPSDVTATIYYQQNGTWISADATRTGSLLTMSIDVPSDATRFRVRFNCTQTSLFKDLRILLE